jgi:hypothetical protein
MTMTFDERLASEMRERCRRYDEFVRLCRDIAVHLGGDWMAREQELDRDGSAYNNSHRSNVYLGDREGNDHIFISINQHQLHDARLRIRATFDFGDSSLGIGLPYGKSTPEISVAMARGAKVIAAEITRRLLPEYTPLAAEIADRVATATATRDRKRGITQRLAKLAGAKPHRFTDSSFETYDSKQPYVEAQISSDVTLKIFNLTEAQAAAVLTLIGGTNG